MKTQLLICLLFTLFASCAESPKTPGTTEAGSKNSKPPVVPAVMHTYYAGFVGNFEADYDKVKDPSTASYGNKINIILSSLENGMAFGHSIIAGNDRPFEGKYTQQNSIFKITATEPGDDPHDGKFEFTLDTVKMLLTGKWYSNDTSIAVPVRNFNLEKKVFAYNPENNFDESVVGAAFYDPKAELSEEGRYEAVTKKVLKLNASTKKLTTKDIENLYKGDLEMIRNAIYARHGYSFRNRRVRYMFDNYVDWYIPNSVDVRNELTQLEKENADLIKRYEDHAGKYYDEFSR